MGSVVGAAAVALLTAACSMGTGGSSDAASATPTEQAASPSEPVEEVCGLVIATYGPEAIDVGRIEALFGDLPEPADDAADCFADAVEASRPAVFHIVAFTVEGDPILETVRVDQDAAIEVTTDSTHDQFGSGEVATARYECGWDRSAQQPAPCAP